MKTEKYTDRARNIIQAAQAFAASSKHQHVLPEHLLKVLLEEDGFCKILVEQAGGKLSEIKALLQSSLTKIPQVRQQNHNELYLSSPLVNVLTLSLTLAEKAGDDFITVEHLLQALSMEHTATTADLLQRGGFSLSALEKVIHDIRTGITVDYSDSSSNSYSNALKKYTRDLTTDSQNGKLDPVIGRDEEIRRAIQVLSRRTKNNPVLIGEPGVGKTAIVEGLAQRIFNGDIPESLKNKKLLALDLGAMIAGAKYRGEFEERFKGILSEIQVAAGTVVLFIDEMHTLVGAGNIEGAMDASNLLKPALARGELHCIGATTLAEYRKYVEKDAAFARRFQPVFINEPTIEDTISILRGIKAKYEQHHRVRISDSSLITATTLSNRYIADRFLPDKAIDLVDEAAARLRMQVDSKPEVLDEIDRRILQLKIEREALQIEKDIASKDRLSHIKKELTNLEQRSAIITQRWQEEKQKLGQAADLKKELEKARNTLISAQRKGEFQKAGELAYGKIPALEKQLNKIEEEQDNHGSLLEETVTIDHIAQIVARWTGIPVETMLAGERERLLKMEDELARRVIGQEEAVQAVSRAVRRARAGLQDPNRPIGSFIFLGSTGVGKTELAKALAAFLFHDEKTALLRLDMSEFMEKHSVSRLIGAPPGYIGYEEGGSLTEAVRRRPYQVILFDEIEKAHPDVFNLLLQILDDGRLTDGQGHTVSFCNTLIIMTSNIGAEYFIQKYEVERHTNVMKALQAVFKPEFLNRIDEIVLFRCLQSVEMVAIVDLQLFKVQTLVENRKIRLDIHQEARQWLAKQGYDPIYGARPLKRVIQKEVVDPLADCLLSGTIKDNSTVRIVRADDHLNFITIDI